MSELLRHDRQLALSHRRLIGVDEAGRGALAGPVVAGAVCLLPEFWCSSLLLRYGKQFNDSKKLSAKQRETLYLTIQQGAAQDLLVYATAEGSVAEIAERNILKATYLAMERAISSIHSQLKEKQQLLADVNRLNEGLQKSELIIVDGLPLKPFPYEHLALTQGDSKSLSVAMASICAKYVRDQLMYQLSEAFPGYGWHSNKGYGSRAHIQALRDNGSTPQHRELFLRGIFASRQQTLLAL
ncbi:MAG: ribonuclease HII [Verrucomicrobia bacterium]|nr:ribonuclease HII [Verrucomicrobiota bacterium]